VFTGSFLTQRPWRLRYARVAPWTRSERTQSPVKKVAAVLYVCVYIYIYIHICVCFSLDASSGLLATRWRLRLPGLTLNPLFFSLVVVA